MKKIQFILLVLLPLVCFSQKKTHGNITTLQSDSYQVSQVFNYNENTLQKNKIFIELHQEKRPSDFPENNFYLDKDTEYFIAYIVNDTDDNINFNLQDGSLFVIQEAKNKQGKWIPIEHWMYSDCGNSYDTSLNLNKKTYAVFPVKIYKGNYKTKIRLKFLDFKTKKIYYSDPFDGSVNYSNFKDPNWKKSENDYISYF